MKLIGVVGQQGSGKDTAAEYIAGHYGLTHVSTSDQIRDYIRKHKLGETTRDVIQRTITDLRAKHGPAVIVDQILKAYPGQDLVLSGLRHPAEAQAIVDRGGFILALNTPQKERYDRSKGRDRVGDKISFSEFSKLEQKENGAEAATYNIQAIVDSAKDHVSNNGSFEDFYQQLDTCMAYHNIPKS